MESESSTVAKLSAIAGRIDSLPRGESMITRMVTIHVPPDKAGDAERTWKQELGPLVARQTGCLSHLLLRSREVPNKFVSISNWASKHAVDQFVQGEEREEIKNFTRAVLGATDVAVELYEAFG